MYQTKCVIIKLANNAFGFGEFFFNFYLCDHIQVNSMDFQDFAVDLPHIFWRLDSQNKLSSSVHKCKKKPNASRVKLMQPPFLDNRLISRFKYTTRVSSDKLNTF